MKRTRWYSMTCLVVLFAGICYLSTDRSQHKPKHVDSCCATTLYHNADRSYDIEAPAMVSSYLEDISADPSLVAKGATYKIFAELNTNMFDSVVIDKAPLGVGEILLDGAIFNQFTMYDDGTHGDLIAGDSIYTRTGFTYTWQSSIRTLSAQIMYRFTPVKYYTGASYVEEPNLDLVLPLAAYDTSQIQPSIITSVNDTLQYSEYTINIKRPAKWGDNPFPHWSYYSNSDVFSEFFCSDNNFIGVQVTTNNPSIGTGSGATFGPSSNFTQGIGKDTVDLGLPFVGIMTLHWIRYLQVYTNHEFLHKWCAVQDLYGQTSSNEGVSNFGHWAFINLTKSGIYGPTSYEYDSLQHVNQDTFLVWRNWGSLGGLSERLYWNNLEKYMAGLLPIDSVPWPLVYLKDWEIVGPFSPQPITVTGTLDTITKADWLSVVGPRVPAVGPSDYNVVQVVFSDELLDAGQMSYFDEGFRLAMMDTLPINGPSFHQATGGLASIKNSLFPRYYNEYVEICPGSNYNGYDTPGIYIDSLVASNGCDSIVTLELELITDDVFGDCCPDNLYADNTPLADGVYKANIEVHSDKMVNMNGNVVFAGGESVMLNEGFEVDQGSIFEAIIDNCQLINLDPEEIDSPDK